jgi:hypothetical protein
LQSRRLGGEEQNDFGQNHALAPKGSRNWTGDAPTSRAEGETKTGGNCREKPQKSQEFKNWHDRFEPEATEGKLFEQCDITR